MQGVCWLLSLGLAGALAVLSKDQMAHHAIKVYRNKAVTHGHSWVARHCKRLVGLLNQKNVAIKKLTAAADAVRRDKGLSEPEKHFQVHTLEVFQKELNESEHLVFQAVHSLQRVLQGDYRDVVNMKESSRQRLEALREAAIKEEQEYVELVAAEKHQQEAVKSALTQNKSLSMLDEILEDVRKAADRLEEEIEEHAFDNNKQMKGVNVEAVLRVEEDEENGGKKKNKSRLKEVEDNLGLSMLIDSQNNQYVLTKPRDSTMPRADHHFIKDLVSVVMLSLPCGWICTLVGLPPMFGYVVSGVLLGPSGLNSIKSMVQVETLGELGVFFTLFVVGLEFSPERLQKVWKTSVQGSCYLCLLMVGAGLLWGLCLHIRPTQTVFISTCLSLSSTPLVSRFLAGGSRVDKEGDLDYSSVLLGMLVMQDVQLGLFIAVMPTLIQAQSGDLESFLFGGLRVLYLLAQVLLSLAAVLLLCLLLKSFLIGPFYKKLHAESKGNKEILVLGMAAFVFFMLTITEFLDVSMELGCFLAGALLSSQGHMVTVEVMGCIEPIRDFLAIIFFASIGLHVFPTFVLYELTILLVLTLTLVIMKFIMAVLVLSVILPPSSRHIRWIVSAGLAQVSEFSFVLGSRARRAGIISREVYLLVLSVTTLSLLLAPLLWRVTTNKWVPRTERKTLT
ncbi:transmembrane and coiled-coil domain-containing protein 3 isoform X1 [Melanotaenia boesemani]|uniref:transmembrane and coiled-coil domain-containing protein 3 isoform X1 n=1 Tax=Melanotaenia boesemani TaxID=1250792 RepID=UPI001C058BB5|nr:transmembrane and coiled-coil domain-containing protein 3 isoform X1 [Melanotaenia boesemani]XP_041840201.1 transmembrane and coiled-coil domain-containing protein 3 isoform X1 [Melanotaenia boesemani]XP_041840210.1 transmembrane and coiled-coil domain-containing protein 3 isoform X1 [Melanotaenia boesemani]XP_041840218.1 transmembrane and coiled-coil domain-containing protein 3 isoform X1 [Melanotaenia boesemani]XP_041840226.1 transmembrane and coiled-coil domain-containing protein 3 isofor